MIMKINYVQNVIERIINRASLKAKCEYAKIQFKQLTSLDVKAYGQIWK